MVSAYSGECSPIAVLAKICTTLSWPWYAYTKLIGSVSTARKSLCEDEYFLQRINTGVYISKPHLGFLYLTLRSTLIIPPLNLFTSIAINMFAFAIASAALVATASALPTLSARQNPCNALGAGSTDSLSYNFTIAAIDMDAPDNSTGAPLALTTGPPGTSGEASTWWISTISASYQSDFPTFSLVGGALIPNPGPHEQGLAVYDNAVNPGSELEFTVSLPSSGLSNDATYCAVSDANGYATIAVNERTDKFALCEATGSAYIVVYEPSTTNDGLYQADTCVAKRLRAVRV